MSKGNDIYGSFVCVLMPPPPLPKLVLFVHNRDCSGCIFFPVWRVLFYHIAVSLHLTFLFHLFSCHLFPFFFGFIQDSLSFIGLFYCKVKKKKLNSAFYSILDMFFFIFYLYCNLLFFMVCMVSLFLTYSIILCFHTLYCSTFPIVSSYSCISFPDRVLNQYYFFISVVYVY